MARSPIYLEAQARLRDFIAEAGLGPGDRLPPEAVLAERLGVSRLSLREATRSLQTLGVIEARHGNGLFVSAFSFRPLIEQLPYGLAAAGTGMEVGLMPAVARLNPQVELAECARLADEMTALEGAGKAITEVDKRFHLLLYRALGNPLVDNLIEVFWELFTRLGDSIPVPPEGGRGAVHLQIIRALQAGDAGESIAAMQQHFDDIRVRAALLRHPESDAG
jgi:DNA-binding FadR family transcriptional regulator